MPVPCDFAKLERLLAHDADDEWDAATADHVSECEHCQSELESLAADEWWWQDSRTWLPECDTWEDLETTGVVPSEDHEWSETTDLRLDFLDPPSHPELLGQLGKYQIEHLIGRGGMGVVLKGFDTELNRTVAIKVLAPHLASSGTARRRFAREARAAAAVVHDHAVAIYGIETDGELPYIVMPFVSGESLQKHVERRGPLDTIEVVRIAMQIASGLQAAHEQGLVHRDIKPANILLEHQVGRVMITDFGLARAADDASITRSGLVAGTPHYMSPEQAHGQTVDQRSDLFSLGSVMYFMATGRAPFRGDGVMAVLHAICQREPRQASEVFESVPSPLEHVLARLLRKAPDDRYGTASQLRELLAQYLAHLQSPSRHRLPKELSTAAKPWPRRAALATMLCVIVITTLAWRSGAPAPTHPAVIPNATAESSDPHTVMKQLDTDIVGFENAAQELASEMEQLRQAWSDPNSFELYQDDWNQQWSALHDEMTNIQQQWSDATDP